MLTFAAARVSDKEAKTPISEKSKGPFTYIARQSRSARTAFGTYFCSTTTDNSFAVRITAIKLRPFTHVGTDESGGKRQTAKMSGRRIISNTAATQTPLCNYFAKNKKSTIQLMGCFSPAEQISHFGKKIITALPPVCKVNLMHWPFQMLNPSFDKNISR